MRRRGPGGKFRAATLADIGVDGVCPACGHLLVRVYDGAANDPHPDPRKFRGRCFTCEPMTDAEQAAQDKQDQRNAGPSMLDLFRRAGQQQ